MREALGRLLHDESGATAIEYGLMGVLIAVAAIGGMSSLGGASHGAWGNVANKVIAVETAS